MGLTVHHLGCSQSERTVWLCEELGIPYELKTYNRAPALAPPEYKALHWTGSAPVITDDGITLAESGACAQYICQKHGGGRMFPGSDHPLYADFVYYFHWTSGSFFPSVGRAAKVLKTDDSEIKDPMIKYMKYKVLQALHHLEERFKDNEWLVGPEFTAADTMLVYTLTTGRYWNPYSLAGYPNILAYLERVSQRDAYKRAMAKSDPGMTLALGPDPPKSRM